jgi:hypothetical protein
MGGLVRTYYVRIYIHTYIHTYVHAYMYTYIHIQTYTCISYFDIFATYHVTGVFTCM